MGKASKGNRVIIQCECTTCRTSGMPGVSRYSTVKNRRKTTGRLELQKYCKYEKKHTLHKETK
jgi:large subunit ribosomal protein L33